MKNENIKIGNIFKLKDKYIDQSDGWFGDLTIQIVSIKKSHFLFGNIITIKEVAKQHPWNFLINNKNTGVISQRKLLRHYIYCEKLTNEYIIKNIIE